MPAGSSLARRRDTYTSIALGVISLSQPVSAASSLSLAAGLGACSSRYSSTVHSRGPSSSTAPASCTRRWAVSISSGPKLSTADVAACDRRSSARRRASSSGNSKGLSM